MTRRRLLASLLLLLAAGLGAWLWENASMPRLTAGFVPWMKKLERWRDAVQDVARAARNREATPADPSGAGDVREWAWRDLDRLHGFYTDVRPPEHPEGGKVETRGRVLIVADGFRADGARVERQAWVEVESPVPGSGGRAAARLVETLSERVEASPRFREATREAGLGAPRNDPPFRLTNRLIDGIWPGSGVAVLDLEKDGDEDLFVADGVRSILYANDGTGRFTDVTGRAGLARSAAEGIRATGVASGDLDGDGFPDLVVTDAFGPTRLFSNRRDGTFEETTASSGVATKGSTRSAALADVDSDGDLDLFVCVTGDYYRQMPDPPFDAEDGGRNHLFLNDGKGRFTDASTAWGLSEPNRWSLSALFADFDADGRPDLLVTNDFGLKNLYRNVDGRRFEDVTGKAGVEDRGYGMSATWGDFDGDGLPDLYTTGTYTQWGFLHRYPSLPVPLPGRVFLPVAVSWMEKMCAGNSLLLQRAGGKFADETERSGAGRSGWCWTAVAADLDSDGWLDLATANGMWGDGRDEDRELEFWWETLAYWDDYIEGKQTFDQKRKAVHGIERDGLFRNRGGAARPGSTLFEERGFLDGLDLQTNGRAIVAFDANGDGALDLYVRSVQAPEALFLGSRREGERFLRLRLAGTPGNDNADGIGARVTARLPGGRLLVREVTLGSGFLSTGSPVLHLGLGGAARVEALTVRWPSGLVQELGPVEPVDRTVVVDGERGLLPAAAAR